MQGGILVHVNPHHVWSTRRVFHAGVTFKAIIGTMMRVKQPVLTTNDGALLSYVASNGQGDSGLLVIVDRRIILQSTGEKTDLCIGQVTFVGLDKPLVKLSVADIFFLRHSTNQGHA